MDKNEAQKLIDKIIKEVEEEGVDHHEVNHIRQGKSNYLELKVSIKIK